MNKFINFVNLAAQRAVNFGKKDLICYCEMCQWSGQLLAGRLASRCC